MNAYEALVAKSAEMTAIIGKIAEEGRMATDEEKARITALKSDVEKINADFASTGRKAFLGGVSTTSPKPGKILTKSESFADVFKGNHSPEDENLSLGRLIRGVALGDWRDAELERKTAMASVSTAGGYLIPEPLSARVIDLARNSSVMITAGAGTVPMTTSTLSMAAVTGDPTVGWYDENQEIAETDVTFGKREFVAKKMAAVARISNELLEDAPNAESIIERTLASAMALELDRTGLLGNGVGKPRGICETAGVNTVTNVGNIIDYAKFLTAIFDIQGHNYRANAMVYSPRTAKSFARLAAGLVNATQFVYPTPEEFRELTRLASNQIPNNLGVGANESVAVVGQFDQYLFALRSQMRLEVSRDADDAFKKDQTLIRVVWRGDGMAIQPKAFSVLSGIV